MATDLADLIEPSTTALITMELQRGVCGDLATMPILAEAVSEARLVANAATVLRAARPPGIPVVHCTFSLLADRAGTPLNAPLIKALVKNPLHLPHGQPAAELIPELGAEPTDLCSNRHHGFSPFTGTDLDAILRARGVTSVVVIGMSLNLGIPGTVVEAVNLGYRVVVATDCVAGLPRDYGLAVLTNTLALVATLATSAEIIAAWA